MPYFFHHQPFPNISEATVMNDIRGFNRHDTAMFVRVHEVFSLLPISCSSFYFMRSQNPVSNHSASIPRGFQAGEGGKAGDDRGANRVAGTAHGGRRPFCRGVVSLHRSNKSHPWGREKRFGIYCHMESRYDIRAFFIKGSVSEDRSRTMPRSRRRQRRVRNDGSRHGGRLRRTRRRKLGADHPRGRMAKRGQEKTSCGLTSSLWRR